MWITSEVNLPEPLIEAQSNRTLVIFAGAGVSIPPPSNYPNFDELADQVAEGTLERGEYEPVDRFLGRLEKRGVKVRQRVQKILSDPNSRPNQLHRDLLSLFPSLDDVRLVTTNFDVHFHFVVMEEFYIKIDTFWAPALPLGHQFHGIVYLHGCVDDDHEKFVLTDSDFGKAYLAEGWANRFLQRMFSAEYTVLFVGYRHRDPDMYYLARGLPSESLGLRYALTSPGDEEHWELLGIKPVTYPLKDGVNKHSALGDAIAAWVSLAKMGALDHERRIKVIVELPPTQDLIDSDYIESSLKQPETIRYFCRHAKSSEWLRWAEDKGCFSTLFQPGENVDEGAIEIAQWFAENYVCEHPDEALSLVQRQGQKLNYPLWSSICARLHRSPKPDSRTLAKWIAVLIDSAESHFSSQSLSFILSDSSFPDDNLTALLLFEHLTKPRLELKPYFGFLLEEENGEERVDVEITLPGDEYWLRESWEKVFRLNLEYFALRLEPIITANLRSAHNLLVSFEMADDRSDKISVFRSAIEPHEQDRHGGKLNILIDAARDISEWMLEHESSHAHAIIESWSISEIPILKRLAIHGITESSILTPDEKITWVLDKEWLYAFGMKHEIYRLLETAYPNASEETRLRLLEDAELGPRGREAENHE